MYFFIYLSNFYAAIWGGRGGFLNPHAKQLTTKQESKKPKYGSEEIYDNV